MRAWLHPNRVLAVAVLFALTLVNCGGGEAPTPVPEEQASPEAQPEDTPTATPAEAEAPVTEDFEDIPRDETLIVMSGGEAEAGRNPDWKNFNVHVPGGTGGWHTGALQTMNEPIIMFTVLTGEHENWLAEDWEANDDFTTFTVTLRDGIEWSDGEPLTAEDVAFTYNLVKEHEGEMTHTGGIGTMKEVRVIDEKTVKFVLNESSPSWWITNLSSNHGPSEQILAKHIWKDVENPLEFTFYDPGKGWPVGTGPYELAQANAEQKIFVRRDDWWAAKTGFKELPKVKKVVYVPDRKESTRAQMAIKNELDAGSLVPVDTLKTMFQQNEDIITWSLQDPPYGYLDWCPIGLFVNNASDHPIAQDARIRSAIGQYFDRDKLANLAESGAGTPAVHMITPYEWFQPFERQLEQELYEKYNISYTEAFPERGDQLMREAGYEKNDQGLWEKDGQVLEMNIPFPGWLQRYGVHVVQALKDAGFKAEMDRTPGRGQQFNRGEIPFNFGCKGPSGVKGMDPYYMASLYSSATYREVGEPSVNPWATARWRNEEFDKLVRQMRTLSPEQPKTKELFIDAMDIWFQEMPDIYISQLIIRHWGNRARWAGWPTKNDNYGFLHPWQQEFLRTIIRLEPAQ